MQPIDDLTHLERTIELADEAVEEGNHPFAAILVDASGATRRRPAVPPNLTAKARLTSTATWAP